MKKLSQDMTALATHMAEVAARMAHDAKTETGYDGMLTIHGRELLGAAQMVADWAEGVED